MLGDDQEDYFKFVLDASQEVNLSLTGLTGAVDLELLDGSGQSLAVFDGVRD